MLETGGRAAAQASVARARNSHSSERGYLRACSLSDADAAILLETPASAERRQYQPGGRVMLARRVIGGRSNVSPTCYQERLLESFEPQRRKLLEGMLSQIELELITAC